MMASLEVTGISLILITIIIDLPKIIIHPWKITLYGSGTFGRGERFNAFGSETFQAFRVSRGGVPSPDGVTVAPHVVV